MEYGGHITVTDNLTRHRKHTVGSSKFFFFCCWGGPVWSSFLCVCASLHASVWVTACKLVMWRSPSKADERGSSVWALIGAIRAPCVHVCVCVFGQSQWSSPLQCSTVETNEACLWSGMSLEIFSWCLLCSHTFFFPCYRVYSGKHIFFIAGHEMVHFSSTVWEWESFSCFFLSHSKKCKKKSWKPCKRTYVSVKYSKMDSSGLEEEIVIT